MVLAQELRTLTIEALVGGRVYQKAGSFWLPVTPHFGRWAENWIIAPVRYSERDRGVLGMLTVWHEVVNRIDIGQNAKGELVVVTSTEKSDAAADNWLMRADGSVDPWWLSDLAGLVAASCIDDIPKGDWL